MKARLVLYVGFLSALISFFACAQTLTWSPLTEGAVWDTTSENWLNGAMPTAWVSGADAHFLSAASVSIIEVVEELEVGSITFAAGANGVTLAGPGRLQGLASIVAADAAATNAVATEVLALEGLSLSGSGAVALGRVAGRVSVNSGTLLAAASDFATAVVEVEGGSLVTLGAPSFAENLLLNGSFEQPPLDADSYKYVSAGGNGVIESWDAVVPNYIVRSYPTQPNSTWISGGSVPHGDHVLIVQRHGAIEQAFTVVESGFYQVAFDYFRRRAFIPHAVTALIDGARLPTLLNVHDQFDTAHYVSVPIYLSAGSHTVQLLGCGTWYDSSSMIDLVTVAQPSASQPCRALTRDSFVSLAPGVSALLNHHGDLELAYLDAGSASVSGPGTWSAIAPVYRYDTSWEPGVPADNPLALLEFSSDAVVPSSLARHLVISEPATLSGDGITMSNLVATFDATPRITARAPATINVPLALPEVYTNTPSYGGTDVLPVDLFVDAAAPVTIASLNNHRYAAMYKTGPSSLTLLQPLVSSPNSSRGGGFLIYDGNVSVPSFVTNPDDTNDIFIYALPARSASLTVTGATEFRGGNLSLGGDGTPILNILDNVDSSGRTLLQAEVNTLHVVDGKTYSTVYLARDNNTSDTAGKGLLLKTGGGILAVSRASSNANFPGYAGQTIIREGTIRIFEDADPSVNSGRGGALGQAPATLPILLGDSLTPPAARPSLALAGGATLIAHDITVNSSAKIIQEEGGRLEIPRTITLNAQLNFTGQHNSVLSLGTLYAGAVAQKVVFDGIQEVSVTDAAGVDMDIVDRTLKLSPGVPQTTTFSRLAANSGSVVFEFAGSHDMVIADSLTLTNLSVNLVYAGTTTPFAEPGSYTLFSSPQLSANYQGFQVANAVGTFDYLFNKDGDSLVLSITPKASLSAFVWKNPASGEFATAGNWSGNEVPDTADDVVLGAAITGDATVTLTQPAAVNLLNIVHPLNRYTLTGSGSATLTLGALEVTHGSHTISSTLIPATLSPLPITVNSGAMLTLANTTLQGGLGGTMPLTLDGASALTLAGAEFEAAYSGELSGSGRLTLDVPGAVQRLSNSTALNTTPLAVNNGELLLGATAFTAPATVNGGGKVSAATPAQNGLSAFWYSGTHSNAVLSRAALESVAAGTPQKVEIVAGESGEFHFNNLAEVAPQRDYWLLILRGTIAIPESDTYIFHIVGDDNVYLDIDGRTIATKTPVGTSVASAGYLTAGTHDIVIGLYQKTESAYLRLYTSRLYSKRASLPNSWLTPLLSLPSVSGSGALELEADSNLRLFNGGYRYPQAVNSSQPIPLTRVELPRLSGWEDSVFNKLNSMDDLSITSATSLGFGGLFVNSAGHASFETSGVLSPAARLVLNSNATLTVAADQGIASISGPGGIALSSPVTVFHITGDADCGISSEKTYTHAIDFGTSSGNAVGAINGVPFLSTSATSGTCIGTDGISYGYTNMPPTGHGGNSNTSASGNIGKLLRDMNYAHRNEAFSLTGLDPAKTYELRIYQRQWSPSQRRQLLGFSANDSGNIDHTFVFSSDIEAKAYCYGYRYRPSASGSISVRCTPLLWADSMHLYGLTNEEVLPSAGNQPAVTLSVAPPAGTFAQHDGALTGDGMVEVVGPGTQAFSGANVTAGGLVVSGGSATLQDGASVSASVSIQESGTLRILGAATVNGVSGDGALVLGEPSEADIKLLEPYIEILSDDASTGISPAKSYTHLYDFGNGSPAVINGVAFERVTEDTATFTSSPALGTHNGSIFGDPALGTVSPGSALYTLLYDMMYVQAPINENDGYKDTTITLSGLTPGQPHELRIYNRSWGWNSTRHQLLAFCTTADGVYRDHIYFNPDGLLPNALVYRYIPETGEVKFRLSPSFPNNGYHIYGLSNEILPGSTTLTSGLSINIPAERTDVFTGAISGPAPLYKGGAGTLMLGGSSTATGPFTIGAGALGVALSDIVPLTSGVATFAPGSGYIWDWSAPVSGGTLVAGKVTLPVGFTIIAAGSDQPPARRAVVVSMEAPMMTELEDISLQGFPNSARAEYSADRKTLYICNPHGTIMLIR